MSEPRRPRARRGAARIIGCFALVLVALSCAVCGVTALGRHAIVTHIARERLRDQGIECDARFAVEVSWTLDEARIGPTWCSLSGGAIESLELIDPVRIAIAGREPTRIEGGMVRVTVREGAMAPSTGIGAWSAVLVALAIPERVGALVGGLAMLAARQPPPTELTSIEIVRRGEPIASLSGVHVDGAQPLGVRVDRLTLMSLGGPLGARAEAAITAIESTSTPSRVELAGELDVDAALPFVGAQRLRQALRITADALDTPAPTYRVGVPPHPSN